MVGPIARILLRYLSGVLIAGGMLTPELGNELAADPDAINLAMAAVGAVIAIGTEGYYWLAKKFGWNT